MPQLSDDVIMGIVYLLLTILAASVLSAIWQVNKVRKDLKQVGKIAASLKNPTRMDATAGDN